MTAKDELERALALADAALAEEQKADAVHVDEDTVELRLRREAIVQHGVESVDGAARALFAHEERCGRRFGRLGQRARRIGLPRDDDAREPERKEAARRLRPRLAVQRIEVRELGLAEDLNAGGDDAVKCPASASPHF